MKYGNNCFICGSILGKWQKKYCSRKCIAKSQVKIKDYELEYIRNNLHKNNKVIADELGIKLCTVKNAMIRWKIIRDKKLASNLCRFKGKKVSELARLNIKKAAETRVKRTKKHCENISRAKKGMVFGDEQLKNMRDGAKKKRGRTPKWSEDGLKRLCEARAGNKSRKGQIQSKKERKLKSEAMKRKWVSGCMKVPFRKNRCYKYGGEVMRSSWEIKVAKYLDDFKYCWKYEPTRFNLSCGSYLPDFFVEKLNRDIEVKGILTVENVFQMHAFVNETNNNLIFIDDINNIDLHRRWFVW